MKEEALGQWNHPLSAEAWKADQERRAKFESRSVENEREQGTDAKAIRK